MSWIKRIADVFRSNRLDRELQDELRFHLDSREQHFQAQGMTPAEAQREARRALGGHDRAIEDCRDADRVRWLETLWRDFRYSLRGLRANPLFTVTALLSLALGVGANTAVFTLLHTALWKPLPVPEPQQLVHFLRADPRNASDLGGGYSNILFQQISDAVRPFGEVAATSSYTSRKFGMDVSCTERVAGESVSLNYFGVLGVKAAAGRTFAPGDGSVLVLSHDFWTRRFQADPSILGKTVFYRELPYTVIGIAARDFRGLEPHAAIDVWLPIAADVPRWMASADTHWLRLIARLKPGVNRREAQGTLDGFFRATVARDLLPRITEHFRPDVAAQHLLIKPAAAGLSSMGRRYERPLLVLLGVATLVLLICCANVANLVLARNRARAKEIAMRLALGAGRARIASQLLTESLLLAVTGAVLGIAIASPACRLLLQLLRQPNVPFAFNFAPDPSILAFTAAIAIGTAVLFGLFPALGAARNATDLKSGGRTTSRFSAGRMLVAGQLALSLVLLIGAGLFLGTLRNFRSIDFGLATENVWSFDVSFPRGTPPDRVRQAYAQIRNGLADSPGVIAASHDTGAGWSATAEVEGRPAAPGEDNEVGVIAAGPDWFETIQLGLVAGRYLNARDIGGPPVAVINARLARRYFGSESPIGRRMLIRTGGNTPLREIVGVVRDAKHYGLKEKEWPMAFIPTADNGSFVVRTREGFQPATIRTVAGTAAPAQVERIRTYREGIDNSLDQERLMAALCTVFAGLATLLAGIGLYGVLAYSVSRRTTELGIRMALGAQRRDVESLVMRDTAWMIVAGTVAGIAGAFAASRLIAAMLYGVRPAEPTVYLLAALLLAAIAVLAGWLPARRASRVDPLVALRYE